MKHIDLFSGIGGASLALDNVFGKKNIEHIFVENDPFCQEVLKKHWPKATYFGDIRKFTADSYRNGRSGRNEEINPAESREQAQRLAARRSESSSVSTTLTHSSLRESGQQTEQKGRQDTSGSNIDFLTGGFPCQPFSNAGRRKGTTDDRYLWPEMLRVIKEFKPTWIVGENVAGILSMAQQEGNVDMESEAYTGEDFDRDISAGGIIWRILNDLEEAGYYVQPFLIPAVALDAPHRRDRVWIVANSKSDRTRGESLQIRGKNGRQDNECLSESNNADTITTNSSSKRRSRRIEGIKIQERYEAESGQARKLEGRPERPSGFDTDSERQRHKGNGEARQDTKGQHRQLNREGSNQRPGWGRHWLEVATELCLLDDGLPEGLDKTERTAIQKAVKYFGRKETERILGINLEKVNPFRANELKALGNAWVPQVAEEIFKAIKSLIPPR